MLFAIINTDPGLWLFGSTRAGQRLLLSLVGIDQGLLARISRDLARLSVVKHLVQPLPMSWRRAGYRADMDQQLRIREYPLERIEVPTLVVHGTADRVVPPSHAQFVAGRVRGAECIMVEGGGHLCAATHREEVLPRVVNFLEVPAPAVTVG